MSFCVTVRFEIRPEHLAAFLPRMRRQAEDSLALEPGCRVFEIWTASDRPNDVHLHEIYDDLAAFEAHLASAHFLSFDADTRPMIVTRDIARWDRPA